jgi:hypothetical protein
MIYWIINFFVMLIAFSAFWFMGYQSGKKDGAFLEKQKHIVNFRWPEV